MSSSSSTTNPQIIIPQVIPIQIPDIDNVILDDNDDDNDDDNNTNNSNYKYANEILSKELLNLSFEHRNAYQEEIHGVGCMAPNETPKMIQESLRKLDLELKNNATSLDCNYKQAYLQSQHLYSVYKKQYEDDNNHSNNNGNNATNNGKDNATNDNNQDSLSQSSSSPPPRILQPSYINSNAFRICFLRCELFHIQKAAVRLLKYLTYVKEFFGVYY